MAREVRLPSGTEYLSVVEAAVHIATNLHPFTPYSEAPTDVIARIRHKATFEAMRDKMVRMIKSQQLRTIDKLTLLTEEYQPSGLLMELDFTFDKLEDMKISLSQFIDICKDEHLSVFVDPNYHLIPPEPAEPIEQTEEQDSQTNRDRTSQFHVLVWRIYQHLTQKHNRKIKAQEVWNEIQRRHKEHDVERIILNATSDFIEWESIYGNISNQQRSSFDSTLSKLKKNPPI
jgi:hypothetical protein